jgi:hypothetical protein
MLDKLEPKVEKCVFIGYPKQTIGYTFYHKFEGKVFVAKNGSFLEKKFLSKEVSGRKLMTRIMKLRTMLLLNRAGRQGRVPLLNGMATLS